MQRTNGMKPEMAAPPRVIRPLPPAATTGPGNVRPLPPPQIGAGIAPSPSGKMGFGGMKSGGSVSASKRADGIAKRGHTKGKMV